MGTIGFSYVGFIFILMLTIPNILWTKNKPIGYSTVKENKLLLLMERVGQVFVTLFAVIFTDFNWQGWSLWSLLLIAAFLLMLLYEYWWFRYFRSEKKLEDFYSSIAGVPVAGATLPVTAFFLLGIYGKNMALIVSIIVLGIGHIGIHLQHRKAIRNKDHEHHC